MDKNMKQKIAERLKGLREGKGLTQGDLAKALEPIYSRLTSEQKEKKVFNEDNGKGTISSLENVNRSITIDIALAYSEYFSVSIDFILYRDENWKPGYDYIENITGLNDSAITELYVLRKSHQGQFETDILSYLVSNGHLQKILTHLRVLMTSVYRQAGLNENRLYSAADEYEFSKKMVDIYREICNEGLSFFFNQSKEIFELEAPQNIEMLEALKEQIDKSIEVLSSTNKINQQDFNASLVRVMLKKGETSK